MKRWLLISGLVAVLAIAVTWLWLRVESLDAIVRGGETNYVSATLSLYVSLYNIFTSLLQILGVLGGDRD